MKNIQLFSRVSFLEKLLFTRHLAIMLHAGISLTEALSTLIEQARSKNFKKILTQIRSDVENGQSLEKSLGKHTKVFNPFYLSLVKVGEESGTIEENLGFLAKHLAKQLALKKKVQAALLYPGLVLTATTILGAGIAFFILPQLVKFFEGFEIELPLATKILLFFANTMKNHGILMFFSSAVLLFLSSLFLRLPKVKPIWHKIKLKLPILGPFLQNVELANFSRNLGIMLRSGIPISDGLSICAETLGNLAFQNDLKTVKGSVEKGESIAKVLDSKRFFEFPPLTAKMIGVGEKSGKLEETLLYLGDFYEEEVDNASKNLSTILEPLLLLFIGAVVGFVALSIITPIYQLTGSIRR